MKKLLVCLISVMITATCAFAVSCDNNQADNSADAPASVQSTGGQTSPAGGNSADTSVSHSIWSSEREAYTWTPATAMENGDGDGERQTTVYLVGDSTVCEYDFDKEMLTYASTPDKCYYFMRNGYGMWFDDYLNDNVTVRNLALSGRSSRSFIKENNYKTLVNSISAGDYLVIGFGHNDQKTGDYYTNPSSQVVHEDSFKYYLYNYYVKLALDKGATPILCTPIIRAGKTYGNTNFHITSNGSLEGGDYPKAIRELGEQFGITVIDLTQITKDFFTAKTYDETKQYFAAKGTHEMYENDTLSRDNTHLNSYGAATVAYKFMTALATTDNTLKYYVDADKLVEPDVSVRISRQTFYTKG